MLVAEHGEHAQCCQKAGEHDASGAEVAGSQHEDQSENDSELKGPNPPATNAECQMINLSNNSYNASYTQRYQFMQVSG